MFPMLGLDTTIGLLRGCATRHRAFDLAFDFLCASWKSVTLYRLNSEGMVTVCSTGHPHSSLSLTLDVSVGDEPRYLFQCSQSRGSRPTRRALLELRDELGDALTRLESAGGHPTRPMTVAQRAPQASPSRTPPPSPRRVPQASPPRGVAAVSRPAVRRVPQSIPPRGVAAVRPGPPPPPVPAARRASSPAPGVEPRGASPVTLVH